MTLKFSEIIPDCKNATVKLQLDYKGAWSANAAVTELKMKRD